VGDIREALAATIPYARSSNGKAAWEIVSTLIPYIALWYGAVTLLDAGNFWFLLPVIGIALLYIRFFLLFHDCLHANLFPEPRSNRIAAFLIGLIFNVPSRYWKEEHLMHHATAQNLDRRGRGDVLLLTVKEYRALKPRDRLMYRAVRSWPGLFFIEMIVRWLFLYRLPGTAHSQKAARGILWTNLGCVCLIGFMVWAVGWKDYLIIQSLVIVIGGGLGVWIFVAQHEFEDTKWERAEHWTPRLTPWAGSSYLKLPAFGHWILNNVSYHHIHHLNPRVPGYHLAACHKSNPVFDTAPSLTLKDAWRCWKCQLWDEDAGRVVSFAHNAAGR
jgi:omega-6 fatty acid desaturase (delta-12 desaturase)